MGAAGNGSNLCSSRVGERDNKSINTKLLPDFTADEMQVSPPNGNSSLTHVKLQRSWSSVQAFVVEHIASKDLDLDWSKEVVESHGFRYVGWNDLRDIALYSLHVFFKTAVEMISHEGYTEDAVIHAIVDSALCYQFDGPITKIADSARALLQSGRQVDSSLSENLDTHLHMLGFYLLSYASSLLKKYYPFLTWSDALWCILLCDMDISIARAFSVDMSAYGNEQPGGHVMNNQNVNKPSEGYRYSAAESPGGPALFHSEEAQRMWSNILTDYIVSIQKYAGKDQVASGQDQVGPSGQVEKSSSLPRTVVQYNKKLTKGISTKRSPVKSQKDYGKEMFFESFQQVKGYGKASSRKLKESKSVIAFLESARSTLTGTSKVANTKGLKSSTLVSTLPLPSLFSLKRMGAPTVVSTPPLSSPVSHSSSSSSTGKAANKQKTKPDGFVHFSLPNTLADSFEFYFSHDGMRTTWVPKDRKEELALDLIRCLGELKLEVKVWTDWANERVMQSTSRLAKDKSVLVSLRKEKEEVEECGVLTRKKLEETQRAIDSTSDELDCANSLALDLTDKISLCRLDKEAANLQEKQSDASFADILRKENGSLERLKSMEAEKILLQEELAAERSNLSKLLKNLEQAKGYEGVLKKRCLEGEKMIDEAMKKVYFERNELERIEILARTESNLLLLSAQNEKQRLQASVKHLEQQVEERLELVRQELREVASSSKHQSVAKIMNPPGFGLDPVRREQECVMCLEEEISVVFLPCRHQIVCVGCSQLHQHQGMTDCPSCRSPIKRRICARFAGS